MTRTRLFETFVIWDFGRWWWCWRWVMAAQRYLMGLWWWWGDASVFSGYDAEGMVGSERESGWS